MDNLLLIKNIDPDTLSKEELDVLLVVKNMQAESVQHTLCSALEDFGCQMEMRRSLHGVSVKVLKDDIPRLICFLCNKNIEIFGIYHLYFD